MRSLISIALAGGGYLLYALGGVAVTVLFFYGIYSLFFKSIALGLMMIGASVVGGWLVQLVANMMMAMGVRASLSGMNRD